MARSIRRAAVASIASARVRRVRRVTVPWARASSIARASCSSSGECAATSMSERASVVIRNPVRVHDVFLGQLSLVEGERVVVHPEAMRHGQVDARRLELADAVHAERGLV